jgi:hypothetical protein
MKTRVSGHTFTIIVSPKLQLFFFFYLSFKFIIHLNGRRRGHAQIKTKEIVINLRLGLVVASRCRGRAQIKTSEIECPPCLLAVMLLGNLR